MITLGIDPGWSSFGISMVKDDALVGKTSFVPKDSGSIINFIGTLNLWILEQLEAQLHGWEPVSEIYIERFVTYGGVQTDPENILMLIGALDYFFSTEYTKPQLVRALDWKVRLCHHLVKTKGVSNPSKSLDKKYSIWAAEQLSGEKIKSDHEADAVCLGYLTSEILKKKG